MRKLIEHKWEGGICPSKCIRKVQFRNGSVRDIYTAQERNCLRWPHLNLDSDIVKFWEDVAWSYYS
jgi:hypothetical protein